MASDESIITEDLKNRQICAALIQDLGSCHNVSQILINTAIVYMHQFYEKFSYNDLKPVYVAITAFYLASKSEDCARKLNDIIRTVFHLCSKQMENHMEKIVASVHALESIMLMSVGFPRMDFVHPHTIIWEIVAKYELNKVFAETAYFICTAMLHFTTLVTRYETRDIAAGALYVAAKWCCLDLKEINSKPWYTLISPRLSISILQNITKEFLEVYVRTPTKLKVKSIQFLKRFNKNNPQNVHSTSSSSSAKQVKLPKQSISDSHSSEPLKTEQLEDGEIDQSSEEHLRNDHGSQGGRRLSLHQYYQRKDGNDVVNNQQKATYNQSGAYKGNNDISKSYGQMSTVPHEKKRKHEASSSSSNVQKFARHDNLKQSEPNKASFQNNPGQMTPEDYYSSF